MYNWKYRYIISFALAIYSYLNVTAVEVFQYYKILIPQLVVISSFLAIIFLLWETNRLIYNILDKKEHYSFNLKIGLNFGFSSISTLVFSLSVYFLAIYFSGTSVSPVALKLFIVFSFRINLFLNILNMFFLILNNLNKTNKELENYKKQIAKSQIQTLQNQLNPHFLFNNLSVLGGLISIDQKSSLEFVEKFSLVYRQLLKNSNEEVTLLSEELELVKAYSHLLETRFQNNLKIIIEIEHSLLNYYVVSLSLQMLIENAVKHNKISKSNPMLIEILTTKKLGQEIIVRNTKAIKFVEPLNKTGIGHKSINTRYKFLVNKEIFVNEDEDTYEVRLPLIKNIIQRESFSNMLN